MSHSCNIVYAELAVELGEAKMTANANKAGINSSFKVDDNETAKGNYDAVSYTHLDVYKRQSWTLSVNLPQQGHL